MNENNKPTESVDSLRALKRRIYVWAAIAGLLAILIGWIPKALAGTTTASEQVIFPATAVLCLGLLIVLCFTRIRLIWTELSLFAIIASSLLGRYYEILNSPENPIDTEHLAAFSDLFYWFPLVYVVAFLLFESRRQLLIGSLVFYAAIVIPGASHVIRDWWWENNITHLYLFSRFFLANAAYIVLLGVSARLNEQYVRVRTLAEAMTHLAHTDTLIQIANRRELDETVAREINLAIRHHQSLAIILFDLDNFKQVNDTYGHDVGDTVLKEIARIVRGLVRIPDLLGRWGGEEFLIVAPQTDTAQARGLAERLRQAIANSHFDHVGRFTASFGVAEYRFPESPADWLRRVDDALYTAKQGGRNQVAIAG